MQHSKSLNSFAFSCIDSDRENLILPNRPRKRSSLDTFLIPGRTRIPSQKSETLDLQVTQNLLRSSMNQLKDPPPYSKEPDPEQHRHSQDHSHAGRPQDSSRESSGTDRLPGEPIFSIVHQPSPRSRLTEGIVIPPRRLQRRELSSNNPYRHISSPHPPFRPSYDGAHDYINHESRITSTTWSTVSKLSHRIFSDSSESSRRYSSTKYNHDYNELASKYGLPRLTFASSGTLYVSKNRSADF